MRKINQFRGRRNIKNGTTTAHTRFAYNRNLRFEPLEDRRMLATITWVNRNTFTGTTDNHFDEAFNVTTPFGNVDTSMRDQAILVVDAAIAEWARVISSFNYTSPSTTYQLTVSMTSPAQGSGPGSIDAKTPPGLVGFTDGKPSSATINIGWRSGLARTGNEMSGWYVDPTPYDIEEFLGTSNSGSNRTNAFFGLYPGGLGSLDLFSTVEHEIGHAMGLYNNATLKSFAKKSTVSDAIAGSGFYWTIHTSHIDALWTSSDSGGDAGGPAHAADAGISPVIDSVQYYGTNSLMNSRDQFHGRKLIDDNLAIILQDVFGYTVNLPSSFGTFYDRVSDTGVLRINTPTGGNDTVSVTGNGTSVHVQMTIGNPVPGIDPTNISSDFVVNPADAIVVYTYDGHDYVSLGALNQATATIVQEGGDGDDILQIVGTSGVDSVVADQSTVKSTGVNVIQYGGVAALSFGSFNTSDSFTYDDHLSTASHTWDIKYDRVVFPGYPVTMFVSTFGSLKFLGGSGAETVQLEGNRESTQALDIETGDGNDTIYVGYGSSPLIYNFAPLTINAGAGSDGITWYVVDNVFSDATRTVSYPTSVDGGTGYNVLQIVDTGRVTSGVSELYDLYADHFQITDVGTGISANVSYDNMQAMTLACSTSSGTVNVHSVSSDLDIGNQFTISLTPGTNNVTLFPHDSSGNLTINGNLAIGGTSSTNDSFTIDDTASNLAISYLFLNLYGPGTTNISGIGSRGVGIGNNVENLKIKGGGGDDTFLINSFQSGIAMRIEGGNGNDRVNFGVSSLAADIPSMSSFSFDGQIGSDTLTVNNSASTAALTYTQNSGVVSITGGTPNYSLGENSVETLVLNAGSGVDLFAINVVPTGSQTIANGNAGIDGLALGLGTFNLDSIQGVVTYNAGADGGNLAATNLFNSAGRVVHLTSTSLGATPGDTLFGAGGALYFNGVTNSGTSPGITLNLGSGADAVFAQPLSGARVTINGNNPTTTPGDTLHVDFSNVTSPVFTSNGTGAGTYTFGNAMALNYTGIESAAAGIPGDFDGNGTVATPDYSLWRAAFGNHVPLGTSADANGDGAVSAADYVLWRSNLGRHAPGVGSGVATVAASDSQPATAEVNASPVAVVETQNRKQSVASAFTVTSVSSGLEIHRPGRSRQHLNALQAKGVLVDLLLNDSSKLGKRAFAGPMTFERDSSHQCDQTPEDEVFASIGDDFAPGQLLN